MKGINHDSSKYLMICDESTAEANLFILQGITRLHTEIEVYVLALPQSCNEQMVISLLLS